VKRTPTAAVLDDEAIDQRAFQPQVRTRQSGLEKPRAEDQRRPRFWLTWK
jgi:hypothetical protein